MAIQIQGGSGALWEVDGATFRAMRVTARPLDYGIRGTYRNAATATGILWELKYPGTGICIINKFQASAVVVGSASASAALGSVSATIVRNISSDGNGTLQATTSINTSKSRYNMAKPVAEIRLTAAGFTGTPDAQPVASVAIATGTGALTTTLTPTHLGLDDGVLLDSSDGHPVILVSAEGLSVAHSGIGSQTPTIGGICAWSEATAF